MDILFWTQSNPNIAVEHTTKKYFGKYLYKIVVYCPAGRLIDGKGTMSNELEHRRDVAKNIDKSGWWGYRYNKNLENANIELLELMRDIRRNPHGIKLRVEEPRIQVYANTEIELIELVQTRLQPFLSNIESVSGPEDILAEEILNSGSIIRKKDLGFQFKVIIRDGRYNSSVKNNILTYIDSLGTDVIQVSKSGRSMLSKGSGFIWNLYFYTNDPHVVTFLNLIHPNLVSNCHELVVIPHK